MAQRCQSGPGKGRQHQPVAWRPAGRLNWLQFQI